MGKGRPQKYNRVSSQQKFLLRRLIIKEKMSVKQAAETLNINYSTAKTIMFSYRQNFTQMLSLSPTLSNSSASHEASYIEASFSPLHPVEKPKPTIEIVSSIGGGDWMKLQYGLHESTDQNKYNRT